MYISSLLYIDLAIFILLLCPPLNVSPFSPIWVASYWGNWFISTARFNDWMQSLNRILSNYFPKIIFSLTVPWRIHGSCIENEIVPFIYTLPEIYFISPNIAFNKDDLPLEVSPTITIISPCFTSKLIFYNVNCFWFSSF